MARLLCLLLLLLWAGPAYAWGPAIHVAVASAALEAAVRLGLPLAALLLRHRRAFLQGTLAADQTVAKSLAAPEDHCHNWEVAFRLLEAAGEEATAAFVWGYLAHLAADTVAHNLFVPHHLVSHPQCRGAAHAYWEVRADELAGEAAWSRLARLAGGGHRDGERLLAAHLRPTLFSHGVSRRLFGGWVAVVSRPGWRRAVGRAALRSRWPLSPVVLRPYRDLAVARTVELLARGPEAACVRCEDPTGRAALRRAGRLRRLLRQGGWSDEVAAFVPGQGVSCATGGVTSQGRWARLQAMEPPRTS
ncbi:MAG: hypothetical protein D6739_03990 [Nitrospirae bacterium]|nr:MAG: hypothetical protein D6739_03990 [Nitrospirota bacterium]